MTRHGNERPRAAVIKFGGSNATTLEGANVEYLSGFLREVAPLLLSMYARAILSIGGGPRVRVEQQRYTTNEEKDTAGIRIIREHAHQLVSIARSIGLSVASSVPRNERELRELVHNHREFALVLGGLKTGQSSDAAAVTAAEVLQDEGYDAVIVMLSNIRHIFTADPKVNAGARPIQRASIDALVADGVVVNDPKLFVPGMNVALDPVAVSRLQERGRRGKPIRLWFGHGSDVANAKRFLSGKPVQGGTELVSRNKRTAYYE